MSILMNKNVAESIDTDWKPKVDTLFYVVDRKNGGVVAKYKVSIEHGLSKLEHVYRRDVNIYRLLLSSVFIISTPSTTLRRATS